MTKPTADTPHKSEPQSPHSKVQKTSGQHRPAVQSRSIKSERNILVAAEQLFEKHGYAGTRVSDIIDLSKSATSSFYHRFSSKRGLFDVMMEHYLDEAVQNTAALDLSKKTHGEVLPMLQYLSKAIVDSVIHHRGFYRAAQELSMSEPDIWRSMRDATRQICDLVWERMGKFGEEFAAEDPQKVARQATQLMVILTLQTQLRGGLLFSGDREEFEHLAAMSAWGILCGPSMPHK